MDKTNSLDETVKVIIKEGMAVVLREAQANPIWYAVYSGADLLDLGPKVPIAFCEYESQAGELLKEHSEFGYYEKVTATADFTFADEETDETRSGRNIELILAGVSIDARDAFAKKKTWYAAYVGSEIVFCQYESHARKFIAKDGLTGFFEPVTIQTVKDQ